MQYASSRRLAPRFARPKVPLQPCIADWNLGFQGGKTNETQNWTPLARRHGDFAFRERVAPREALLFMSRPTGRHERTSSERPKGRGHLSCNRPPESSSKCNESSSEVNQKLILASIRSTRKISTKASW